MSGADDEFAEFLAGAEPRLASYLHYATGGADHAEDVFATRPSGDKTQVLSPTVMGDVTEPVFGEVFVHRTWDTDGPLAGPLPPAGAARGKPGPDGRFIVLQAPDGPRVRQALEELEVPRGWNSTSRSDQGVRALLASPELPGAELARLSGGLAPLPD